MRATLLLPAAGRFGGQRLSVAGARALARADRLPDGPQGRRAQLLRHFRLVPNHWPVAALTRQADASDAAGAAWLRADPCHVLPDINGARLLACGEALQLAREDVDALLPALKPLFGDAGFQIDAPTPSRWYLRLPAQSTWPEFAEPGEALGTDVFDHLPQGPENRRWRTLLSEAQVLLHNHPWNARRAAQGKPPVNSLWFWGGGVLPDHVESPHAAYAGDGETGIALAHVAGLSVTRQAGFSGVDRDTLFDLVRLRDLEALERDWLLPALAALSERRLDVLEIDTGDGLRLALRRSHRWRFWRRARGDLVIRADAAPGPQA
jgi:hypothetical protein